MKEVCFCACFRNTATVTGECWKKQAEKLGTAWGRLVETGWKTVDNLEFSTLSTGFSTGWFWHKK
jgi:hypothetical protein